MFNRQIAEYLANNGYESWQRAPLTKLLRRYPYLFGTPYGTHFPYTSLCTAEIRTYTDNPIWSNLKPYPSVYNQAVNNYIGELLADGIIRPSDSPYNAPVWIVPQAGNELRIVIDYKNLNWETIPDRYPLPSLNGILLQLGNNSFFSVLKLKSGYYQLLLEEADMEKTAFSVHNGQFEFTRLPMGFRNAPAIFQRTLDDILQEHIGNICFVYMGSIIVFSQNKESHLYDLETIFKSLDDFSILCDLDRCDLLQNRVNFSGFLVSNIGIEPSQSKVKAIASYACPKTIKALRGFLGLSGFYRCFIKDYAKLAKPLTSLLQNGNNAPKHVSDKIQLHLNQVAINAFNKLKNYLLHNEVILKFPDFSQVFDLTTEAYGHAIGGKLSQDGQPITFISRTLSKAEENYSTNEKEMLAIVWALQSLKIYIYDNTRINIFTDFDPDIWNTWNGRTQRWQSLLTNYNYTLCYKI